MYSPFTEDAYVDGRSFSVTCNAAEISTIPLDADPNNFEITTKLDLTVVQFGNITDPSLSLSYSTAQVFEKKQYETSSLSLSLTDNDGSQKNSNATKGSKEVFEAKDTIQVDAQTIRSKEIVIWP